MQTVITIVSKSLMDVDYCSRSLEVNKLFRNVLPCNPEDIHICKQT